MTKPLMMMMMNEGKMNTVPGWAAAGSVCLLFFINMDFLQHTVAIQTHSHHWLMFLLPSSGGRKLEASQSAAVTCDHRRSSGPWSHDPRGAAVLSGGGWRGHSDSQSIDTRRRRCFSANNIFCQGCFAATLLSGKPLSLHWQTLPSLQDFTFFSAPLFARGRFHICGKLLLLFPLFFIFPTFHGNEVWTVEGGVSRQSAIESNDASVSAIVPLGNQLAGFSPWTEIIPCWIDLSVVVVGLNCWWLSCDLTETQGVTFMCLMCHVLLSIPW